MCGEKQAYRSLHTAIAGRPTPAETLWKRKAALESICQTCELIYPECGVFPENCYHE